MRRHVLTALLAAALAAPAWAQHDHPMSMPMPTPSPSPSSSPSPSPSASPMAMPSSAPRATLFESDMSRMTGMTPRDPMAGMAMTSWTPMFMGVVRLAGNHQGGPSGDDAVESSSWAMGMVQRDAGPGRLTLMMMNSLEPATVPEGGSPELFQTGESLQGRPLVDHQHPHDFFMNLSATYRMSIGDGAGAWLQVAPVGEPALGPVAFMHRASAGENPTAPLGHHWLDSTHITASVITIGGGRGPVAVEASVFHGREPDEHRWNLDLGAPDSFSARLKARLGHGWSGQLSWGFIHDAEELVPGDVRRTTAALYYGEEGDRPLAASLLWGHNREDHGTSDAFVLEGAWQIDTADQLYARAERVEKDLALLATKSLPAETPDGSAAAAAETVPVRAFTLGYVRTLAAKGSLSLALGADLTLYAFPSSLREAYGDHPASTHVFARVRWGRAHAMHMDGGHAHAEMDAGGGTP